MKKLFLYLMLAGVTLLTTQCKKDGATGPQGPQGITGASGSSSVRTKKITLTNAQWGAGTTTHWFTYTTGTATGWAARYVDITEPIITQAIMDNGLVQVYFTPDVTTGSQAFTNLPYSHNNSTRTFNFNVDYTYQMGKIRLYFFLSSDAGAPLPPAVAGWDIPSYTFKYIIIPGTEISAVGNVKTNKQEKLVQLKGNVYNVTEIKNMSYSQLSKLLDIK